MVPEGSEVTLLGCPLRFGKTLPLGLQTSPFSCPLVPSVAVSQSQPCRGQVGGAPPHQDVRALQVGSVGKSSAQVDGNSSLVLHPLIKEQHGVWECTATNQVASVTTATSVHVLGELPVTGMVLGWAMCWKRWSKPPGVTLLPARYQSPRCHQRLRAPTAAGSQHLLGARL